jgi:hypothetical protein
MACSWRLLGQIGMRSKVEGISLGQGQGVLAARLIEEALVKGSWILLQVSYPAHLPRHTCTSRCTYTSCEHASSWGGSLGPGACLTGVNRYLVSEGPCLTYG